MSRKQLYFFRHGQTDWNKNERFHGHADIPLNDTGRKQAKNLIPILNAHQVEIILSSDLSRARETAQIVADSISIPVNHDPALREGHIGKAQGLTKDQILNTFGEDLTNRWRSVDRAHVHTRYPEGESGQEIIDRVVGYLTQTLSNTPHTRIGVSTHGGVIRRFLQNLLPHLKEAVPIPNGILYLVEFDPHKKEFFFSPSIDGCISKSSAG